MRSSATATHSFVPLADRVFLIGMMASGKTTIGARLARALGYRFLDSDAQVCANTGRTVREIFETDGEAAFRAEEKKALADAASLPDDAVVAVAGGAVLDPANRALLDRAGPVVWLRAPAAVLAGRLEAGADHRPLLGDDPASALARLDAERRPIYEALADFTIDVDEASPDVVVERIVQSLRPAKL
jgi:shikimate kinase